jgi:hypothetical protein
MKKYLFLLVAFMVVFVMPSVAQTVEEVSKMPSWLQLLSDNWIGIAAFIGGAVLKETWVLAVNKFIKKSRVIIAKLKEGLEDTDDLLDVFEDITEDGDVNKAEILKGVKAGKEYSAEIKGIIVSFKKKK